MTSKEIILKAAELQGLGKYGEAIQLLEQNIRIFDEAEIVAARLQLIYAAQSLDNRAKAIEHALELQMIEPDMPTVKAILGK